MENERSSEITVYRPNQRHDLGLLKTWPVMARNVIKSRDLIWQLFKRDFFACYKKSFIGFTWIFLSPIMGIASWVLLKQTNILQPGDVGDISYIAYVLVGTMTWGLFMSFYAGAASTLSAGQSLVMQVKYPHEALLFQQAARRIANFSLTFVVVIVVMLAFGERLRWTILLFPVVALPLFLLGSAIGLVLSMISIVAVDLSTAVNKVMALLMFATPIIYTDNVRSPFLQQVIRINPLTYLVCSARDIVLYGRLYEPTVYFACATGSLLAFLISWRLFFVSEEKIIERMI